MPVIVDDAQISKLIEEASRDAGPFNYSGFYHAFKNAVAEVCQNWARQDSPHTLKIAAESAAMGGYPDAHLMLVIENERGAKLKLHIQPGGQGDRFMFQTRRDWGSHLGGDTLYGLIRPLVSMKAADLLDLPERQLFDNAGPTLRTMLNHVISKSPALGLT